MNKGKESHLHKYCAHFSSLCKHLRLQKEILYNRQTKSRRTFRMKTDFCSSISFCFFVSHVNSFFYLEVFGLTVYADQFDTNIYIELLLGKFFHTTTLYSQKTVSLLLHFFLCCVVLHIASVSSCIFLSYVGVHVYVCGSFVSTIFRVKN